MNYDAIGPCLAPVAFRMYLGNWNCFNFSEKNQLFPSTITINTKELPTGVLVRWLVGRLAGLHICSQINASQKRKREAFLIVFLVPKQLFTLSMAETDPPPRLVCWIERFDQTYECFVRVLPDLQSSSVY